MMPLLPMLALILAGLLSAAPAHAQEVETGDVPEVALEPPPPPEDAAFRAFVDRLRPRALAAGVSAATFDREMAGVTPNPRVVRLDRAQPGGTPDLIQPAAYARFAPYKARHVDTARIEGGQRRYPLLRSRLAATEARTGVPESIMLAIFGHETGYGTYVGSFDLIRSLATLAYDGRRSALFTEELIAALRLIDRGVPRNRLVGSWAGATGYPQFLPSIYLRVGTDGDGDGKADIWGSEADALASIGAYLANAGWKPGVPWGVAVIVPSTLDRAGLRSPLLSPRCPRVHQRHSRWLTMREWRARGVMIAGAPAPADDELATLIEPDGPDATAYLLSTNYRAILDYNCSNYYALSVGLLADEVAR